MKLGDLLQILRAQHQGVDVFLLTPDAEGRTALASELRVTHVLGERDQIILAPAEGPWGHKEFKRQGAGAEELGAEKGNSK